MINKNLQTFGSYVKTNVAHVNSGNVQKTFQYLNSGIQEYIADMENVINELRKDNKEIREILLSMTKPNTNKSNTDKSAKVENDKNNSNKK